MSAGRSIVPTINVPPDNCGPAMLALNPGQRAFVFGKVHLGFNNTAAARHAGYARSSSHDSLKAIAWALAHNEAVIAAIIEESRKVLRSEGPRSIQTLVKIRDDKSKEAKDRIKAAVELLNRGGLQAVSESHITVEHKLTDAQKDRRILELCRELGIGETEARKMLITPDVIDAEFTEVPPQQPLTEEQEKRRARLPRDNVIRRQRSRMTREELAAHKIATNEARREKAKVRYAEAQHAPQETVTADEDPFAVPAEKDQTHE